MTPTIRRGVPDRDHVKELFARFRETQDPEVRQELIELHLGLVEYLARRFAGRGEPLEDLKRHFRDKGWAVRVPRRLQELNLQLGDITGKLSQELGRTPTVAEMAQAAGTTEDEILEGLESAHAYTLTSLDAPTGEEDLALRDQIGSEDETIELLEYRTSLTPLLDELPPRERTMLYLRFFKGMTQSEIADKLGISQMHVSRLLAKTLATLREGLES